MPVVSTTAYDQAEDALTLARSLVNDAAGTVFSDAVLMPFLNSGYRELQRQLAESGVSVLVSQQDVDLPLTNGVTTTEISDVSTPQLPTDLLAPHQLWEQASGSSDIFLPMEKITGDCRIFCPEAICGCGNGARIRFNWWARRRKSRFGFDTKSSCQRWCLARIRCRYVRRSILWRTLWRRWRRVREGHALLRRICCWQRRRRSIN